MQTAHAMWPSFDMWVKADPIRFIMIGIICLLIGIACVMTIMLSNAYDDIKIQMSTIRQGVEREKKYAEIEKQIDNANKQIEKANLAMNDMGAQLSDMTFELDAKISELDELIKVGINKGGKRMDSYLRLNFPTQYYKIKNGLTVINGDKS